MGGKFTPEVTNQVHPGPPVDYTVEYYIQGKNLYEFMCRLQADPTSRFIFESKEESFGHLVTKINGLEQDADKNNYWMLYINDLEHLSPVGVDGLKPRNDEKYIWAYTHYTEDHPNILRK